MAAAQTEYVLPPLTKSRGDRQLFPLLAGAGATPLEDGGRLFPRSITFLDGTPAPLFRAGVVAVQEMEEMLDGLARAIISQYQGKKLLFVTVLEGAIPFSRALLHRAGQAGLAFRIATIKVSSYATGSEAGKHRIVQPLLDERGLEVDGLGQWDGVVIVDDLIDTGETMAWLVNSYLPALQPRKLEACFLLDKQVERRAEVEALAAITPMIGRRVPNEWLVGFGLDMAMPAIGDQEPLHLFREPLPGGIYSFNDTIEKRLLKEYEEQPDYFIEQLEVYFSQK